MSEIKELEFDAEFVDLRKSYNGQQTSAGGILLTPKQYVFFGEDAKEKGDKFIDLVKEELKKLSKQYNEQAVFFWRQKPELLSNKDYDRNITEYRWVSRFATWPPSPMIHLIFNSLNSPKAES